nr:ATP-binding protein [uncultured Desulfobacter sp.]
MEHHLEKNQPPLTRLSADQPISSPCLPVTGQIRLAELSVFNWGAFNELHTVRVDPFGTLITGDNGSGKTTLIDGLMALLLPAGKAAFNVAAAQGDKTDRSLLSYMRGSYGSAHDGAGTRIKSKRESAVVTGLRALYKRDDGSSVTLAALFWTTQATNALADVKRVYAVAGRDMALKELLDAFGQGGARTLKQWLRSEPCTTCCDDNFSDYQECYRKLLSMDNKNAPALLSRALGLKKIDDLTKLIRELVLEPSSVKNDARKVVEEFADLVAIHDQLSDARAQKILLEKLPELDGIIRAAGKAEEKLSQEKQSLPAYLGEIYTGLWQQRIIEIKGELTSVSLKIETAETRQREAEELVERRHGEYLQLGGNRIEDLKKDIKFAKDKLNSVVRISSQYQADAEKLGLSSRLDQEVFFRNQSDADGKLADLQREADTSMGEFGTVSGKYSRIQEELSELSEEIRQMEARPDSNIDIRYQQLRDELTNALNLDKKACMFIGELIDVKEEERGWQGAIERALGGLRTTLAVPHDTYAMVTHWLNTRHTGLHVRVQVVRNPGMKLSQVPFKTDGYLKKLIWKKHPYRDWLKKHLEKFDLSCVSDTKELDRTPFSMTRQGLVHFNKGRFEKKDQYRIDDRRKWCLGFSNKSRLSVLKTDKNQLSLNLDTIGKTLTRIKKELSGIEERKHLWEKIKDYTWDGIDTPFWNLKCQRLKEDLKALELAGGDLEKAKSRWEAAKKEFEGIIETLRALDSTQGGIKKELGSAEAEYAKARTEAAKGVADTVKERLEKRIGPVTMDDLKLRSKLRQDADGKLETDLETQRNRKTNAEKKAIGIMSAFRSNEKWQILTVDWHSDIRSLPDYLDHLNLLEKEGLPNLVEQFVERLNKHATQSLAGISAKLESERDDIVERIDTINKVLKRTEFMPGSYLKLGSTKEKYPHVHDFENRLRKVLSQITSDDHEARYVQLATVVDILNKASAPGTSTTLESLRLLDPRYQMSFYAEEIDAATKEVRDVLKSSSGKSGGEKESFAGTIVAASLAYVLTPDGFDRPVYCTVFLDEAFSNTAEAVSKRVLRVFRELHVHVNLITPYKNLNLAREFARSLIIVERDQENHDSRFCEVTWEEIDRMNEEKSRKLVLDAEDLGIELHEQAALHAT